MKYNKPPLAVDEQADLLLSRGMTGDRELMIERLSSVSYYRLTGYWYPFRVADDKFASGTDFEKVWDRYVFDRHLRLLTMDAIERIEIAVRTQLSLRHSHAHGPFAYAEDPASIANLKPYKKQKFLDDVQRETGRSKETFVEHFRKKYGNEHSNLPIWMATEIMSFGTILSLYRGSSRRVQKDVANCFKMPSQVFDSWLLTINTARNICAHHSRLWNRGIGTKPKIPLAKDYPDWHTPYSVDNRNVFAVLTICRYCLRLVAPQTEWHERLVQLLAEYPAIPTAEMGFPENWQESPLWQTNN